MSGVIAPPRATIDPVLLRLPAAAWRALAPLAVTGTAALAAWAFATAGFGPGSPLVPVLVAVCCAFPAAWAIGSLHDRLFDRPPVRYGRRLLLTLLGAGIPAIAFAWSFLTAVVAEAATVPLFPVLALAAAIVAVLCAMVAVVAVPIGAMRADVSLRTLVTVSAVAALRRPLGPLAALAASAALAWLGLTWFGGLLLLVAPLLIVLSAAAAWPVATATGVALPPLAPARRPARGES
jgi:hypothetical protein